jgi:hypothetical protein
MASPSCSGDHEAAAPRRAAWADTAAGEEEPLAVGYAPSGGDASDGTQQQPSRMSQRGRQSRAAKADRAYIDEPSLCNLVTAVAAGFAAAERLARTSVAIVKFGSKDGDLAIVDVVTARIRTMQPAVATQVAAGALGYRPETPV